MKFIKPKIILIIFGGLFLGSQTYANGPEFLYSVCVDTQAKPFGATLAFERVKCDRAAKRRHEKYKHGIFTPRSAQPLVCADPDDGTPYTCYGVRPTCLLGCVEP